MRPGKSNAMPDEIPENGTQPPQSEGEAGQSALRETEMRLFD